MAGPDRTPEHGSRDALGVAETMPQGADALDATQLDPDPEVDTVGTLDATALDALDDQGSTRRHDARSPPGAAADEAPEFLTPTPDPRRGPAPDQRLGTIARGQEIGRYLVLEQVGAGGMGVVYAAYDPTLDRRVALKLLRRGASAGVEARTRLLREAQAMARIAHPSVITVHEVGTVAEHVFLAMEFVDGVTLREWMKGARSWQDALAVFAQAGCGLAAAHDAGLVHRDFKPDNVLFGSDGRVRVTDFGLVATTGATGATGATPEAPGALATRDDARDRPDDPNPRAGTGAGLSGSRTDGPRPEASEAAMAQSGESWDVALTRTGALLGTPKYMSPEQHEGRAATPRSDQFSFCAALFEAVHGVPPFDGQSYAEVSMNCLAGKLRAVPAGAAPAWLERVIRRGLSLNPGERFPSMHAVLAELSRDRAAPRRRVAGLAIAAAVIALFVGGVALWATAGDRGKCRSAGDRFARVWNDDARAALRANLARAAQSPGAGAAAAERIAARIDGYRDEWVAAHGDACEATHVRGEQSADMLDRRMQCLDRRLGAVRALIAAASADGVAPAEAVEAAARLPDLAECADSAALTATVALPRDADARLAIAALEARLADATTQHEMGGYQAALDAALAIAGEAEGLGYAPLESDALQLVGKVYAAQGNYERADEQLERALRRAAVSGSDHRIAGVLIDRLITAVFRARYPVATELATLADAFIVRAGSDTELAVRLLLARGRLWEEQGKFERARDLYQSARELLGRQTEPSEALISMVENNAGNALWRLGELDQALEHYEASLAINVRLFGDDHPRVATAHHNQALVLTDQNKLAAAVQHLDKALAMRIAWLGEGHQQVAETYNALANVARDQGDATASRELAEKALATWTAALGADHPTVATALVTLGNADKALGDLDAAMAHYERALALLTAAYGDKHADVANLQSNIGTVLLDRGRHAEARPWFERAIASASAVFGPDHVSLSELYTNLAIAFRKAGDHDQAAHYYQRALQIAEANLGPEHPHLGVIGFNLGNLELIREQYDAAKLRFERVLALWEKALGPEHPNLAYPLGGLGTIHTEQGRPEQAVPLLERALRLREDSKAPPAALAEMRHALSVALWDSRLDRARAVSLAEQAKANYAAAENADGVERVGRWLREIKRKLGRR